MASLSGKIRDLEEKVPDINNLVCDGRGTVTDCDALCGGAGCGKCGGISCGGGAAQLASNALELGEKSKTQLTQLQEKARKELDNVLIAKSRADEALRQAIAAYERSLAAKNQSEDTTKALQQLLDDIDKFFEDDGARPAQIREVAEQCLAMQISLTPDEILDLARQINQTMAGITNIERILTETASDLSMAGELQAKAVRAENRASDILKTAQDVLNALEAAREAQVFIFYSLNFLCQYNHNFLQLLE